MNYSELPTLHVTVERGVATVVIDNPPVNLLDETLIPSLREFTTRVADDRDVRVIVFESANPELFLAHGEMRFVTEPHRLAAAAAGAAVTPGWNAMQSLHEQIRGLPQVTIGKIAGFARGGGHEFLMALNMRFAAIGRTGLSLPEALVGIIPGGGGTQYLTARTGPARALELILSGEPVDAELAERYGLINRAVPAEELDPFVTALARRIATLAPEVIAAVKALVDAAAAPIDKANLAAENEAFIRLATADDGTLTRKLLAAGAQTPAGERRFEEILLSNR